MFPFDPRRIRVVWSPTAIPSIYQRFPSIYCKIELSLDDAPGANGEFPFARKRVLAQYRHNPDQNDTSASGFPWSDIVPAGGDSDLRLDVDQITQVSTIEMRSGFPKLECTLDSAGTITAMRLWQNTIGYWPGQLVEVRAYALQHKPEREAKGWATVREVVPGAGIYDIDPASIHIEDGGLGYQSGRTVAYIEAPLRSLGDLGGTIVQVRENQDVAFPGTILGTWINSGPTVKQEGWVENPFTTKAKSALIKAAIPGLLEAKVGWRIGFTKSEAGGITISRTWRIIAVDGDVVSFVYDDIAKETAMNVGGSVYYWYGIHATYSQIFTRIANANDADAHAEIIGSTTVGDGNRGQGPVFWFGRDVGRIYSRTPVEMMGIHLKDPRRPGEQGPKVIPTMGDPNGVLKAPPGSLAIRGGESAGPRLWQKDSGHGDRGWTVVR